MKDFGWSRLAYLAITLAVLASLVKLGTLGAASLPERITESGLAVREAATETTNPEKTTAEPSRPSGNETGLDLPEPVVPATPEPALPSAQELDHDHDAVSIYENVDFKTDAPVFYRPAEKKVSGVKSAPSSPANPSTGSSDRDAKVCRNVSAAPDGARIVFPLTDDYFDSYDDSWGAARPQGGHEGTDLMTPDGVPEFAVTDGTVTTVAGANGNGWNTLGGYTVMVEADYSIGPVEEGDLFYYAHMNKPTDLRPGDRVEAGDVVGYSGDTGYGPEVTSGQFPPHLHFGWYDISSGRSQLASGAMNPYPLLEWVKANGGSIEGGSDIPYCEGVQPATPVPSDGGYWQFPSDPGVRPDMDTGTDSAVPSPDAEEIPSAESSPNVTKEEVEEQTSEIVEEAGNAQNGVDPDEIRDEVEQQVEDGMDDAMDDTTVSGGDTEASPGGGAGVQESDIRKRVRELRAEIRERIRQQLAGLTGPDTERPQEVPRPDKPKPEKPRPEKPKPENTEPETIQPETTKPENAEEPETTEVEPDDTSTDSCEREDRPDGASAGVGDERDKKDGQDRKNRGDCEGTGDTGENAGNTGGDNGGNEDAGQEDTETTEPAGENAADDQYREDTVVEPEEEPAG